MHRYNKISIFFFLGLLLFSFPDPTFAGSNDKKSTVKTILKADDFRHYVDYFNRMEDENIAQAIPNSAAWNWMKANIPLFECPQDNFEELFYYRWWTLRKHIKEKPS